MESYLEMRPAKSEHEITKALLWASEEGWDVGRFDAKAYFSSFPTACKVLLLNNQLIGSIFIAKYEGDFYFIGLFIIDKTFRGKGLGKKLWNYAMGEIATNNAALYAVPKQISRYQAAGFKSLSKVHRWKMLSDEVRKESPTPPNNAKSSTITSLRAGNTDLMYRLSCYDDTVFPKPRHTLIQSLLKLQGSMGFAIKKDNAIVGYGLIRLCQSGYRIGPLYADCFENAIELTVKLLEVVKSSGHTIIFDLSSPDQNKNITYYAEYFNLQAICNEDTQVMSKGEVPDKILKAIKVTYAICSLELG